MKARIRTDKFIGKLLDTFADTWLGLRYHQANPPEHPESWLEWVIKFDYVYKIERAQYERVRKQKMKERREEAKRLSLQSDPDRLLRLLLPRVQRKAKVKLIEKWYSVSVDKNFSWLDSYRWGDEGRFETHYATRDAIVVAHQSFMHKAYADVLRGATRAEEEELYTYWRSI